MATVILKEKYRCFDDCRQEGCPEHEATLQFQTVSNAYTFENGKGEKYSFEQGESCTIESPEQRKEEPKKEVQRNVLKDSDFEIVVIDSCEYVVFDRVHGYAGSGGICHKQNCKFCAERSKHNR